MGRTFQSDSGSQIDYLSRPPEDDSPVSKETGELVEHLIAAERLARLEGDDQLNSLVYQSLLRLGQIIVQRSKLLLKDERPD